MSVELFSLPVDRRRQNRCTDHRGTNHKARGRTSALTFRWFARRGGILLTRVRVALLSVRRSAGLYATRGGDTLQDAADQSGLHAGAAGRRTLKAVLQYLHQRGRGEMERRDRKFSRAIYLRPVRGEPFRRARGRPAHLLVRRPRVAAVVRRQHDELVARPRGAKDVPVLDTHSARHRTLEPHSRDTLIPTDQPFPPTRDSR